MIKKHVYKGIIFRWAIIVGFFFEHALLGNEFIVDKKTKPIKEMALRVKEDIADFLESILRQLGKNIGQSVYVQNHVFDMIKDLFDDQTLSTQELKELRSYLTEYLHTLEKHQVDLQNFLYDTKSKKNKKNL